MDKKVFWLNTMIFLAFLASLRFKCVSRDIPVRHMSLAEYGKKDALRGRASGRK